MANCNYNLEFNNLIKSIDKKHKPTLLLQCCCAPCSSAVLEKCLPYFDVTVYYYNPNITDEQEFNLRQNELVKFVKELNNKRTINCSKQAIFTLENLNRNDDIGEIKCITTSYEPKEYISKIVGLENQPEGGNRCTVCYTLRLLQTAKYAKEHNFNYFCSTLSVSPYKNANLLNSIGKELENQFQIKYLPNNFKKENGFKRSVELSQIFKLYRQNYCGCESSKKGISAK